MKLKKCFINVNYKNLIFDSLLFKVTKESVREFLTNLYLERLKTSGKDYLSSHCGQIALSNILSFKKYKLYLKIIMHFKITSIFFGKYIIFHKKILKFWSCD